MDYKKTKAPNTTLTRDMRNYENEDRTVYETIVIVSKRANQIGTELKYELNNKLEEFANYTDNLEEVFENREQIEISKFYERLPKPILISMKEYEDDLLYIRKPDEENEK